MATHELIMPKMGESIVEATILKWTKEIGEEIELEETVLEIATDKVDSDVPSPVEGKLVEKRFEEGDVVPVGEVVAIIALVTEENATATPTTEPQEKHEVPQETAEHELVGSVPFVPKGSSRQQEDPSSHDRFYSPLVLNIARKEGIPMGELDELKGSGRGGRVTKKDILHYVQNRTTHTSKPTHTHENGENSPKAPHQPTQAQHASTLSSSSQKAAPQPITEKKFNHSGAIEIVPMDRMRKLIAENMIYSQHISAHVTSFVEADVTQLVLWREKVKQAFQQRYGEKLTYTPLIAQAISQVLKEFPLVNSSVQGDQILMKKEVNMGVAVALPTNNLIVPVVKHADRLNLAGLTAAVNDLALRARSNKLKPEELEGGTYTLSNVGTFGNVMGTPIIMQPQVAIMAVGAIRKMPAVVETPTGDVIAIRHKMYLSHSYDHRIIDGALGGQFVRRVADLLEQWDMETGI